MNECGDLRWGCRGSSKLKTDAIAIQIRTAPCKHITLQFSPHPRKFSIDPRGLRSRSGYSRQSAPRPQSEPPDNLGRTNQTCLPFRQPLSSSLGPRSPSPPSRLPPQTARQSYTYQRNAKLTSPQPASVKTVNQVNIAKVFQSGNFLPLAWTGNLLPQKTLALFTLFTLFTDQPKWRPP